MTLTKTIETLLAARKSVAELRAAQPRAVTIQMTSGEMAPVHFTLLCPDAALLSIERSLIDAVDTSAEAIRAEITRLQELLVDVVPPTAPAKPEREVLGWFFKVTADGGTSAHRQRVMVRAGDALRGPLFGLGGVALRRMGQNIVVGVGSGEIIVPPKTFGDTVTHIGNESVAGYGATRFVVKAGA